MFTLIFSVIMLLPIIKYKTVKFFTDNSNVFEAVVNKDTKSRYLMPMVRFLYFLAIQFQFVFVIDDISTHNNPLADDLSRGDINSFKSNCNNLNLDYLPNPLELPNMQFLMELKDD